MSNEQMLLDDVAQIKKMLMLLLQRQHGELIAMDEGLNSLAAGVASGDRSIMRRYNKSRRS